MRRPSLTLFVLAGFALLTACGDTPSGASTTVDAAPEVAPQAAVWNEATTVGAVVAARPSTARIFELVGVDYCCGGAQTLSEAADAHDLDVRRLLDALASVGDQAGAAARDWTSAPLEELVDHIVDTHHAYLRRELPRLSEIVATVTRVHGDDHAELAEVKQLYGGLREALEPHLEVEEVEVFPAVLASDDKAKVKALLTEMKQDHDDVGHTLHRLRELTGGYALPADACALYKQMLEGLSALERDLHTHVHLENEVLLPRTLERLKKL